ncbi:MAG: hypothetical protein PVH69_00620 [Desulfobacterales bacterium]|jgi:hypothetical protein
MQNKQDVQVFSDKPLSLKRQASLPGYRSGRLLGTDDRISGRLEKYLKQPYVNVLFTDPNIADEFVKCP